LLVCISSVRAQQTSPIPLRPMTIGGGFVGEGSDPAIDISGIACLPTGAPRTCVLINDSNKNAQFATIQDDSLVVGNVIPLIGNAPDSRTIGSPPDKTCKKADDFEDLDGEGVAYAEPFFYVVGSHGCSRKKGKFRLSSFILARVRVDSQGRPTDGAGQLLKPGNFAAAVETTYRVSDLLKRAGAAAAFFGKDLESEDGLNIEGIAVQGDTIWFGLRAPVIKTAGGKPTAFLVPGSVADLFGPDQGKAVSKPAIPIALEGLGIRDLAPLPDKRLLVLAGADHGPEVPFRLFVVDPANGEAKPIGSLAEVKQLSAGRMETGKAEGVTVLDGASDQAQLVVVFDSLLNGAPHRADISIPK